MAQTLILKLVRLFAFVACVLGAGAAHAAGTVSVSGGILTFTASAGALNSVGIAKVGSTFQVIDNGDIVVPGNASCTQVTSNQVNCAGGTVTLARVFLADGNDAYWGPTAVVATEVWGGFGDDSIVTGGGADTLRGEDGLDTLHGMGGNDTFWGGAGADTINGGNDHDTLNGEAGYDDLEGGPGTDVINGGADSCTVSYLGATAAVSVNLGITTAQNTVGAGTDTITSCSSLEGSAFHDTLVGDGAMNVIMGNDGDDEIWGMGGDDWLFGDDNRRSGPGGTDELHGGAGFDALVGDGGLDVLFGEADGDTIITVGDGIQDFVDCGDGSDEIWPDGVDSWSSCESVKP